MPPKGKLLTVANKQHVVAPRADKKTAGGNATNGDGDANGDTRFFDWKTLQQQQREMLNEFTLDRRAGRALYWLVYHGVAIGVFALTTAVKILRWALYFIPALLERASVMWLNFGLPPKTNPSGKAVENLRTTEWNGVVNTMKDRQLEASITPQLGLSEVGHMNRRYDQIYNAKKNDGKKAAGQWPPLGPQELYNGPILGGDLSTMLSSQKTYLPNPYYRETVASVADGATVCLDWMFAPKGEVKGIIAIIPGLASSSHSPYVELAVSGFTQAGWHCVVINTRGMGTTPLDQCNMSNAGFTDDIRTAVQLCLSAERLNRDLGLRASLPLVMLGFSLGGSMLTKFLGEEGDSPLSRRISAAAAVCSPWDYHDCSENLLGLKQRLVYQKHLLGGLRHFCDRHEEVLLKSPTCDVRTAKDLSTVQDFDENITVPLGGYRSRAHYYTSTNPMPFLKEVKVPFMCMSAMDDPVTGLPPGDAQWERIIAENTNVCLVKAPSGGHLGFPVSLVDSLLDFRSLLCNGDLKVTTNSMERAVLRFFEQETQNQ